MYKCACQNVCLLKNVRTTRFQNLMFGHFWANKWTNGQTFSQAHLYIPAYVSLLCSIAGIDQDHHLILDFQTMLTHVKSYRVLTYIFWIHRLKQPAKCIDNALVWVNYKFELMDFENVTKQMEQSLWTIGPILTLTFGLVCTRKWIFDEICSGMFKLWDYPKNET